MQEIELKFLVPQSRLKGLMRQAKVKSSQVTQLAAHYYDTPDQQLAQAGIGLRIRKEGVAWVQTIKAGGDGIAARLEHNTVLDHAQVQDMLDNNTLMPDLSIYDDTVVAAALSDFSLKKLSKKLICLYVTDVTRTTRLIKDKDSEGSDNCIEVAYDHGQIIHGHDDTQRETIQEIEFELVSGALDFLFTVAGTWCKRYNLSLSTVTKAERGGLLINGYDHSPAVSTDLGQLNINKDSSMPIFMRAVVHNCLLQILPNSSAIVAGSQDDAHIFQLSVGIHRLRSALKAFAGFSDEVNPDWLPALEQTQSILDDGYPLAQIHAHIEPTLQQYGAPTSDWTADLDSAMNNALKSVRANDFQLTLLALIAFTMSDPSLEPCADKVSQDELSHTLSKYYKKYLKAYKAFKKVTSNKADDDNINTNININIDVIHQNHVELHELDCRLRELRYVSEFVASLLPRKKAKHWLKHLNKAQKALTQYAHQVKYQRQYQTKSQTDSSALYGAGWLAASTTHGFGHTEKRLVKFKSQAVCW